MDEMRHAALCAETDGEQEEYSERVRDIMLAQPLNVLSPVEVDYVDTAIGRDS